MNALNEARIKQRKDDVICMSMIKLCRDLCKGKIKIDELIKARDEKVEYVLRKEGLNANLKLGLLQKLVLLTVVCKTRLWIYDYIQSNSTPNIGSFYYAFAVPEASPGDVFTIYTAVSNIPAFRVLIDDPTRFYYMNSYGTCTNNWFGGVQICHGERRNIYQGRVILLLNGDSTTDDACDPYHRVITSNRGSYGTCMYTGGYRDCILKERSKASVLIQRWWRERMEERKTACTLIQRWWVNCLYTPGSGIFYNRAKSHFEESSSAYNYITVG